MSRGVFFARSCPVSHKLFDDGSQAEVDALARAAPSYEPQAPGATLKAQDLINSLCGKLATSRSSPML